MQVGAEFERLVEFLDREARTNEVVGAALQERPQVVAQALILAAIERGVLTEHEAGRIVAHHHLSLSETLDALTEALAIRGCLNRGDVVRAFGLEVSPVGLQATA